MWMARINMATLMKPALIKKNHQTVFAVGKFVTPANFTQLFIALVDFCDCFFVFFAALSGPSEDPGCGFVQLIFLSLNMVAYYL